MPLPAITSHFELNLDIAAPATAVYSMLLRPEWHCELAPMLESVKTQGHTRSSVGQDQHSFIVRYRFPLLRFFSWLVELQCTLTEQTADSMRVVMQTPSFGNIRLRSDYRLHEKSSVTSVHERLMITSPRLIHRHVVQLGSHVHQGLLNGIKYRLEHERIMTAEHVRPFIDHSSVG